MSLRKVSKSRGSFPNDEAVIKLFYLALINIAKKWSIPLRDSKPAQIGLLSNLKKECLDTINCRLHKI